MIRYRGGTFKDSGGYGVIVTLNCLGKEESFRSDERYPTQKIADDAYEKIKAKLLPILGVLDCE